MFIAAKTSKKRTPAGGGRFKTKISSRGRD
jgi:hypothetical protein